MIFTVKRPQSSSFEARSDGSDAVLAGESDGEKCRSRDPQDPPLLLEEDADDGAHELPHLHRPAEPQKIAEGVAARSHDHEICLIPERAEEARACGEHEEEHHDFDFDAAFERDLGRDWKGERCGGVVCDDVAEDDGGDVHGDEDAGVADADVDAPRHELARDFVRHPRLLHRRAQPKRSGDADDDVPFDRGPRLLLCEAPHRDHSSGGEERAHKEVDRASDKGDNHPEHEQD
mmetsp:Transcript_8902/g.29291  ORF Transcript_8902/g.29291 Transcript_8902/m.29291 type:complete len:233 (-) Transcript_8902:1036-1734(-)